MKTLLGSEKQVKWAEKIREEFLSKNLKDKFNAACSYHINGDRSVNPDDIYSIDLKYFTSDGVHLDLELMKKYQDEDILGIIEAQPEAKFWIENRHNLQGNNIPYARDIDRILEVTGSDFDRVKEVGFAYFRPTEV